MQVSLSFPIVKCHEPLQAEHIWDNTCTDIHKIIKSLFNRILIIDLLTNDIILFTHTYKVLSKTSKHLLKVIYKNETFSPN